MKHQKYAFLLASTWLLLSGVTYAVPEGASLSVRVQEAEQNGDLPGPLLELMMEDGRGLEEVTEVTVSTSSSGSYAQGFTHHAICLSGSVEQAQLVHDIAIDSATDQHKAGVTAEAQYSLMQFKGGGCEEAEETVQKDADKKPSNVDEASAKEIVVDVGETVGEELLIDVENLTDDDTEVLTVTMEPLSVDALTGTTAGGASNSF